MTDGAPPVLSNASDVPFRKGRHLSGTDSASDVLTKNVRMVAAHADRVNLLREILLVFGTPGLGKTFAVRHYLEGTSLPYVMLPLTVTASPKEVLSRLLTLLTGQRIKGAAWELRDELCAVLAEQQRIVVIDECAHLSAAALNTLRSLHDEDTANFSLYFCGTAAEQVKVRVPALGDRIAGKVHFQPYSEKEMLKYLTTYHPVFKNTPRPVLEHLYASYARGRFRSWARILQAALPLLDQRGQDRFDVSLANVVVSAIKLPQSRANRDGHASDGGHLRPSPVGQLIAASYGQVLPVPNDTDDTTTAS